MLHMETRQLSSAYCPANMISKLLKTELILTRHWQTIQQAVGSRACNSCLLLMACSKVSASRQPCEDMMCMQAHRFICYLNQVPPANIATCNGPTAGTHSLWDNRHMLRHCTQQCCWGRYLLRTDHTQMHKPHLALSLTQLNALQEATVSLVCMVLGLASSDHKHGDYYTWDAEAQHDKCKSTKRWTPCHR